MQMNLEKLGFWQHRQFGFVCVNILVLETVMAVEFKVSSKEQKQLGQYIIHSVCHWLKNFHKTYLGKSQDSFFSCLQKPS